MRHLTGEATTDKLLLGDAEFKMIPARPLQTTPFAALRTCHPAEGRSTVYFLLSQARCKPRPSLRMACHPEA
jgi:hypothetical protein